MERGIWKPNVEISPACPRCGSANTKFCYYNNYSLTQPRYFCKGCRRYWTKGGSLRNVPIGGGCRKSRRGKSIVNPRVNLVNNNRVESSSLISVEGSSSNIDLAAVYANFLNQPTRNENNQIEGEQIVIPSSFDHQFTDFQNNHQLLSCNHENVFYDTQPMFPGGQFMARNSFMSMNNSVENEMLPPLPGEEVGVSIWPDSDIMLTNQMLPSTTQEIVQPAERDLEVMNGNVGTFCGLNLEAIFRS